jgi:pimeloyl-ACP methyl ester carboxylesterase
MSTFLLLPGAGGSAWYWSRVEPLLQRAGHTVKAVDLPGDDDRAGLEEYTQIVVGEIGDRANTALVAQSLGAFTAAMVCARAPLHSLTFVNAMIPMPHETPGQWWANTGAIKARDAAASAGGYGDFEIGTISCTTCPLRSRPRASPISARRLMPCSVRSATSRRGPTYRYACWSVRMTASFLLSSNAPSLATDSVSRPTSSQEDISSRCHNPTSSPTTCCADTERQLCAAGAPFISVCRAPNRC